MPFKTLIRLLPANISLGSRIFPVLLILAFFAVPVLFLVEWPERVAPEQRNPGQSQPAPDPLPMSGPFALRQTDADRAQWSWAQARDLAADIWEAQSPGAGQLQSFYCGCNILRGAGSGGDIDPASCGYQSRSNSPRAERLEWDHVVPAAMLGQGRSCWTQGAAQCVDNSGRPFQGRECCMIADPVFIIAATDPVNLVPAIGEVNADRSNFRFGTLRQAPWTYGSCQIQIDPAARLAEPPDDRKGDIARIYAYMSRAYGIRIPRETAETYRDWILADPVSDEEIRINAAIAASGHRANPFVLQPELAVE